MKTLLRQGARQLQLDRGRKRHREGGHDRRADRDDQSGGRRALRVVHPGIGVHARWPERRHHHHRWQRDRELHLRRWVVPLRRRAQPNGHVTISLAGGSIGRPAAPGNFPGSGFSPAPTLQAPVADPIANVPQCGDGSPGTTNYCPTTTQTNGNTKNAVLSPGVYSSISGSHTLNPGAYVLKGDITLSGSDLLQPPGRWRDGHLDAATTRHRARAVKWARGSRRPGVVRSNLTALIGWHSAPPAQPSARTSACSLFADRNNTAVQTWRGNGTNENGGASGISGTIYLKSGHHGPAGNGYTAVEPDRGQEFHSP